MKTKSTFIIVLTTLLICTLTFKTRAQITPEFKFYLAFEDGLGNKDTIYLGYDVQGTIGLDSIFGEYNIKHIPFDNVFDVRISDVFTWMPSEGYLGYDPTNFHAKTQILGNPCVNPWWTTFKTIQIIMKVEHFPISVKWNHYDAFDTDSCLYNSLFNIMSPGFWFDIGTQYTNGVAPFVFNIFLRDYNGAVVLDSNSLSSTNFNVNFHYPPEFYIDDNNDTIRLLYLALLPHDALLTIDKYGVNSSYELNLYPNPAQDFITIEGFETNQIQIEIYDVYGRLLLKQKLANESNSICIKELPKGIKFIRLETDKGVFVKKFLKY